MMKTAASVGGATPEVSIFYFLGADKLLSFSVRDYPSGQSRCPVMIGSRHNSAGSVGLSASVEQVNNAAEGTEEPSKLDSLVTNLVPAIDDLTEEQLLPGPANRFIGVSKLSSNSARPTARSDEGRSISIGRGRCNGLAPWRWPLLRIFWQSTFWPKR